MYSICYTRCMYIPTIFRRMIYRHQLSRSHHAETQLLQSCENHSKIFVLSQITLCFTTKMVKNGLLFYTGKSFKDFSLKSIILNSTLIICTPSHDHRFLQVLSHFRGFEPHPRRYFFLKSDIKWAFSYILIY